jgi:transposase, IS5 family
MQTTLFSFDSPNFVKWYNFKNFTKLGEIYDIIDWAGLKSLVPDKKNLSGAPSWLPVEGYFGLMFLKHYTKMSDEKLLERFNTDWAMQMFCGVYLADNQVIRDNAFVSNVRSFVGKYIDMEDFQKKMVGNWTEEIPEKNVSLMDATCYEVYIRFPTDVKLLWESCEWLWEKQIPLISKLNKLKEPRSKFKEQKLKYLTYSKLRRKSHRKTKSRKKALLKLLFKGIDAFQSLLNKTKAINLTSKDAKTFKTIKQIYRQQKCHFEHPEAKIKDRIVSLYKPYIHPIVRGKENKPVEFGIKVHKTQVGGINIIEHQSYDAFNECKRYKIAVLKHKKMFGDCTHTGADRVYATNENRKYATSRKIQTNFSRKGAGKDDKPTKQIKAELNKERSTRLEGSFGNEKEHYLLQKIKARSPTTEKVWLYFGVHTANAVMIANRRQMQKQKPTHTKAA